MRTLFWIALLFVFLQTGDAVLDDCVAQAFCEEMKTVLETGGNHRFDGYTRPLKCEGEDTVGRDAEIERSGEEDQLRALGGSF